MTVAHGLDGWSLCDSDWDSNTGIATMRYERSILGHREVEVVERPQPSNASHVGWKHRDEQLPVFRMN